MQLVEANAKQRRSTSFERGAFLVQTSEPSENERRRDGRL